MLFSDFVFMKFNRVLLAVEHKKTDKLQTLYSSPSNTGEGPNHPKPSKEVQATLHGTPLLQCTQFTNRDLNTQIQRGKRINKTMSFQLKSFTVPNQVVHFLLITCTHTHTNTHTHQIFNNSKSTKMRSNRTISR
jgi:hypothetical protein